MNNFKPIKYIVWKPTWTPTWSPMRCTGTEWQQIPISEKHELKCIVEEHVRCRVSEAMVKWTMWDHIVDHLD